MTTITTDINLATEHLIHGKVVAIPTETVYGLAADATNEAAIRKIFSIKNRPLNHPLIMHVCHDWDLSQWVTDIPDYAKQMIKAFWPGPLTLVLKSKKSVHPLINGGQLSVAIRAPNHNLTQQLLRQLNRPLVAPSANPFGQISPTTARHVAHSFPHEDFLILDGGRCDVGIESSIILATDQNKFSILRPGMIDLKVLEEHPLIQGPSNNPHTRVSGQLDTHYQPQKPLYYINDLRELDNLTDELLNKLYILSFYLLDHKKVKMHHQFPGNEKTVAYQLYDELRYADQSEADMIIIELPPNQPKWRAIREKIIKAGKPYESKK